MPPKVCRTDASSFAAGWALKTSFRRRLCRAGTNKQPFVQKFGVELRQGVRRLFRAEQVPAVALLKRKPVVNRQHPLKVKRVVDRKKLATVLPDVPKVLAKLKQRERHALPFHLPKVLWIQMQQKDGKHVKMAALAPQT